MRVLLSGVAGFIGSHFAKHVLAAQPDAHVIGFARKSDDRNLARLDAVFAEHESWRKRFQLVWGDLCDANALSGICEHVDVVVHMAAKTFVDHAVVDPMPFYQSNVIGTVNLLNDAKRYKVKRFLLVSTDEVLGQILNGSHNESAPICARNDYAASKAGAEAAAMAAFHTHGLGVIITRTENNFGPWQHRQKVLPTFVRYALAGEPLPVYGDGLHVRCWLHVEEHCRAIWHLVKQSMLETELVRRLNKDGAGIMQGTDMFGEVFHVAGEEEMTNIDLARFVLSALADAGRIRTVEDMVRHIPDRDARPGHDRRYALDCAKLRATGFEIKQDLRARLAEAVLWYADHQEWTR